LKRVEAALDFDLASQVRLAAEVRRGLKRSQVSGEMLIGSVRLAAEVRRGLKHSTKTALQDSKLFASLLK